MRNRLLGLVLVATISLSACHRSAKPLETAERYQRENKPALALEIYRDQISRTNPADTHTLSQLQLHSGECYAALDKLTDAFGAYMKAVELDANNTHARLKLGELFLEAGETERATEQALAVMKAGKNLDAIVLIGSAAEANGNDDLARRSFKAVLLEDPKRMHVAIDLADLYNRGGDAENARQVLKSAAEAQPTSSVPWLTLGRLEEQEGNISAAEAAYRHSVDVENSSDTNLRLAQFLERVGRVDEAKEILVKVDQLQPDAPSALGDFALSVGSIHDAQKSYENSLRHGANNSRNKEVRASLISRLIESDLSLAEASASDRVQAVALARAHFDRYAGELPEGTRDVLTAEIALANDDLVQASSATTDALAKMPESAAAHFVAGVVRLRSADAAGARSEWQTALDKDSTFVPARIALAQNALAEHDADAAQQLIIPAVRLEPSNLHALVVFARALTAKQLFNAANSIIARVETVAAHTALPNVLRGELLLAQNNYGRALLEFQQAVVIDSHSRDAIDGLAKVYGMADVTPKMLQQMERIGMADPKSATLLEITGRNFIHLKRYSDAERCLREALDVDPSRHSAAEWLARVQANQGDIEGASRSVASVREFSPMIAGVEAEQRNDLKTASAEYDKAVRAGDPSGVAANNLAWILAQQGNELDRALELANKAREIQPDNPAILDTVGFVHLRRREYTDAITVLEHAQTIALMKQSSDPAALANVRQHLAEAYLRTGQTARAQLVAQMQNSGR